MAADQGKSAGISPLQWAFVGLYLLNALVFFVLSSGYGDLLCGLGFRLSRTVFIDLWPAAQAQLSQMKALGPEGIHCLYDVFALSLVLLLPVVVAGLVVARFVRPHVAGEDIPPGERPKLFLVVSLVIIFLGGYVFFIQTYEPRNVFTLNGLFGGRLLLVYGTAAFLALAIFLAEWIYLLILFMRAPRERGDQA
jgi:hypothetical protein